MNTVCAHEGAVKGSQARFTRRTAHVARVTFAQEKRVSAAKSNGCNHVAVYKLQWVLRTPQTRRSLQREFRMTQIQIHRILDSRTWNDGGPGAEWSQVGGGMVCGEQQQPFGEQSVTS
jgi:hypothetical protein